MTREAVLLVKDEDENYMIEEYKGWISNSRIFQALSNNYMVGRIYMKANSNDETNKERFREIKKGLKDISK